MRHELIQDACSRSQHLVSARNETITIEIREMEIARKIDSLMPALYDNHPHLPQVVELKFFLGLSDEEGADALGIQVPSFQRRWQEARWWLFQKTSEKQSW